jgi:hypothetical protein
LKPGADSLDSWTRELVGLFSQPFMLGVVALLLAVIAAWMFAYVLDKLPELRPNERDRKDAGGGAGKRRTPDRPVDNERADRDPGTTRSQEPDRRADGTWPSESGRPGSPPFGGATGEIGSIIKKNQGSTRGSPGNETRSPWDDRPDRKDGVPVPRRSPDDLQMESLRFASAAGTTGHAAALPPRPAGPDHARLVLEAWRDAWASDVVSVRTLVERMRKVPGVRGVNVLPESSVLVVQFDNELLAVPSQQDFELCEKLFEADRPPGRFATVIDLDRAAVVSSVNGDVVQRGRLRIECG